MMPLFFKTSLPVMNTNLFIKKTWISLFEIKIIQKTQPSPLHNRELILWPDWLIFWLHIYFWCGKYILNQVYQLQYQVKYSNFAFLTMFYVFFNLLSLLSIRQHILAIKSRNALLLNTGRACLITLSQLIY